MPDLDKQPTFDFRHDDIEHRIYRVGSEGAPSILLIQELPGITDHTLALIDRLCVAGYTVYLPHLFGPIGGGPRPLANLADICVRREFYLLARGRSAPFTSWLRALCREMREASGGPVGAIGMCLTGNFVIPLVIDDAVAAPVSCQPGHFGPLWKESTKRSLGIDPADEASVIARANAGRVALLGMRFTDDPMCPRQRFDRMQEIFADGFERIEIESPKRQPWQQPAHSVLTLEFDDAPGSPTRAAYERMLGFFAEHLHSGTSSGR